MITIDVKEYCHSCPMFEADVSGPDVLYSDDFYVATDAVIRCEHREKCNRIEKYLKGEM